MTQVLNLDKLETKRDKVIILGGKEHVMKTLTVKEYVEQMKAGAQLNALALSDDMTEADRIVDITIDALTKLFPTITREQFEALNMDQLTAIRQLAEVSNSEEIGEGEATGKAK